MNLIPALVIVEELGKAPSSDLARTVHDQTTASGGGLVPHPTILGLWGVVEDVEILTRVTSLGYVALFKKAVEFRQHLRILQKKSLQVHIPLWAEPESVNWLFALGSVSAFLGFMKLDHSISRLD